MRSIWIWMAAVCLVGSAVAADAKSWPMPALSWFVRRLPPPPMPNSDDDNADVFHSMKRQAIAKEEDFRKAIRTNEFNVYTFSESIGPDFNAKKYPQTGQFFGRVEASVDSVVSQLKKYYRRERMEVLHPGQVRLLVTRAPGYSFPSGHTARSLVFALLLAQLRPSASDSLLQQAWGIGSDRILSGQHYRTDIRAGRMVGIMVFQKLMADPEFRNAFENLKISEWSHAAKPSH